MRVQILAVQYAPDRIRRAEYAIGPIALTGDGQDIYLDWWQQGDAVDSAIYHRYTDIYLDPQRDS